ncbi:hypothetical protein Tco_1567471, partial [Tanacetum coccineum]
MGDASRDRELLIPVAGDDGGASPKPSPSSTSSSSSGRE